MNIKKVITGSVLILSFIGCYNLEQYPYDTFAVEKSFESLDDANYWTNGVYEGIRSSTHGIFMTIPEMQTDLLDVAKGKSLSEYLRSAYIWEGFNSSENFVLNIWKTYYKAIGNINTAIKGFENITVKNQDQKNELNTYKGAVHLARALYYSKMVMLYCKSYDPTTADTDLGLPILLDVRSKNLPARSTLKETYQQILLDISKAQDLLKGTTPEVGSDVFTQDAALLLKARMLLYKGDWEQAYEVASKLVDAQNYPLANTVEKLQKVWYEDDPQESITQLFASSSEPVSDDARNTLYIGYSKYSFGEIYDPVFLPKQWLLNLYEDTDIRKSVFYVAKPLTLPVEPYTQKDLYLVYKYPGNPNLFSGKNTRYEHAPKIFRIAEAYLIAAEAAYKNNDFVNAAKYLNLLKEARQATPTEKTGEALYQEIKNERLRELAFEGFRLMDLKRWEQPVDRTDKEPQDINFVITSPAEQYTQLKKTADDYRMVWPIPSVEIQEIGKEKIKQNPGW